MNYLSYLSGLKILTGKFKSCSVVNAEGSLLFSKDLEHDVLSTTRLVAFQIVKKYLRPQPQDLFILNDPENGGYQFSKIIMISCLSTNLFIIWNEDHHLIDFKIPPTPIYDRGLKNEFVWQALLKSNLYSARLQSCFEQSKNLLEKFSTVPAFVENLSNPKNQLAWLKSSLEVFNFQFNSKALGSFDSHSKLFSEQLIKLKLTAEEKQSVKLITLDFTNTNQATEIFASSHVAESVILKKLVDFYQLGHFFTQSVLDRIKIILPPKSIVSRPHPTGEFNFEIQSVCSQLCEHNLQQLNSHSRKSQPGFDYCNSISFDIYDESFFSNNLLSSQLTQMKNFEELIANKMILLRKMSRNEKTSHIVFEIAKEGSLFLKIRNWGTSDKNQKIFKINNVNASMGKHILNKKDVVEIIYC